VGSGGRDESGDPRGGMIADWCVRGGERSGSEMLSADQGQTLRQTVYTVECDIGGIQKVLRSGNDSDVHAVGEGPLGRGIKHTAGSQDQSEACVQMPPRSSAC